MRILVLANFGMGLYKFRQELLHSLIVQGDKVYVSLPNDEYVPKLESLGCEFIETNIDRRGTNPVTDIKLLCHYLQIIRGVKPDVVLTYTIKPNVYGGIACRITKTPYISNVTGFGTSLEGGGVLRKITIALYKIGLRRATHVFFQNRSNLDTFHKSKIVKCNTGLTPGSGVNLDQHKFEEYPEDDGTIRLLFIGRVMKAKGINELLEAAVLLKGKLPIVQFELIGGVEENYTNQLDRLDKLGIIKYYGQQDDVHSYIRRSHATVLPSHHEGTANVLLESASSGRPVLASNIPGCIETFDEGVSGLGFNVKCVESLVEAIIKFVDLPHHQKKLMGTNARRKMEKEFDRSIVINAYMSQINKLRRTSHGPV